MLARRGAAIVALATAIGAGAGARASDSISDFGRRDLLPAPPSVTGGAVGGLVNPAAWATVSNGELAFWWSDESVESNSLDQWGIATGGRVGFSAERRTARGPTGRLRVYDYQLGFAGGNRLAHSGVAWRWATGDEGALGRDSGLVLGSVVRPGRGLTYGTSVLLSSSRRYAAGAFDLGIRPLGTPQLTLFGDYTLSSRQRIDDGEWSAGVEVRPTTGVHLGARVTGRSGSGDVGWIVNLGLTLDRLGLHVLPGYSKDGDLGTTTYLVRANPPHSGVPVEGWARERTGARKWKTIDLERRTLGYERDRWFDSRHAAWIDVSRELARVREERGWGGVAVKLSGARIRPSLLWELRRELAACQAAGLEVVVHLDRAKLGGYWLASVADRVVMEPGGDLTIVGVAAQRTYLAGLLRKLGVGFEEHRYFTYKSAAETWSRVDMSDADREQIGREVDVIYELIRRDVCASRGISEAAFEEIVEDRGLLFADEAVERGLVDAAGRWEDVKKWVSERGGSFLDVGPDGPHPDDRWGRPPTVALVYADGASEMDRGFRGRELAEHLEKLAKRPDVAAVVLRSDSPGGDPLPAERVAAGIARVKAQGKPVVVSQGDVAGSAGYRICTNADRLYTTPVTVTGSIGVISAWFWDEGFGEKTGLSADGVQRGPHADLYAGIRLPLIGMRVPTRNLDEGEKARVREGTMKLYGDFVGAVARGRKLPEARVRELGEGRIWMGEDAVERGLCDEVGSLADAIDRARSLAGIGPDDEILIEEFPPRRAFSWPGPPLPRMGLLGASESREDEEDWTWQYLKLLAERPGAPMLVVPPEDIPTGWFEW